MGEVSSGGVVGGTTRFGLMAFDNEADTTGMSALLQMYNLSGGNLIDLGIGCSEPEHRRTGPHAGPHQLHHIGLVERHVDDLPLQRRAVAS